MVGGEIKKMEMERGEKKINSVKVPSLVRVSSLKPNTKFRGI